MIDKSISLDREQKKLSADQLKKIIKLAENNCYL